MGSSIKLDPLDIYRIKKVKDIGFEALIQQGLIELNMVDGLILPNLKMNEKNSCSFLDESGYMNRVRVYAGCFRLEEYIRKGNIIISCKVENVHQK